MRATNNQPAKPRIYVLKEDYDHLLSAALNSDSPGAALLRQELGRAIIVPPQQAPKYIVRLNSRVEFIDQLSGRRSMVTLVEPQEADMDESRLSVLDPAGAALLGLRPGDAFSWTVEGRSQLLTVERVLPPEPVEQK
jgi:regulator of nucleoside diphosphate kinase